MIFSFFEPPEHGCQREDSGHTHANPEIRRRIMWNHVKIKHNNQQKGFQTMLLIGNEICRYDYEV